MPVHHFIKMCVAGAGYFPLLTLTAGVAMRSDDGAGAARPHLFWHGQRR
jgi:hypothetical protein